MTLTIQGFSDDLIEIGGDLREEFEASRDGDLLAFSDGTVLGIIYSAEGVWRITRHHAGRAEYSLVQATANDEDVYSDVATLTGVGLTWVVQGSAIAEATTPLVAADGGTA